MLVKVGLSIPNRFHVELDDFNVDSRAEKHNETTPLLQSRNDQKPRPGQESSGRFVPWA